MSFDLFKLYRYSFRLWFLKRHFQSVTNLYVVSYFINWLTYILLCNTWWRSYSRLREFMSVFYIGYMTFKNHYLNRSSYLEYKFQIYASQSSAEIKNLNQKLVSDYLKVGAVTKIWTWDLDIISVAL